MNIVFYRALITSSQCTLKTVEADATPKNLRYVILVHWVTPIEYRKSLVYVGEEDSASKRPIVWRSLPSCFLHGSAYDGAFDHFSEAPGFDQQLSIFEQELERTTI